jgi:hypothetical protein
LIPVNAAPEMHHLSNGDQSNVLAEIISGANPGDHARMLATSGHLGAVTACDLEPDYGNAGQRHAAGIA